MTKIINVYGGPGTGKSTTAAHVFALLKLAGVNCELVTEYAKDLVWEESLGALDNQLYVFAEQYHRLWRLLDKVDYIITDSPLLLSLYYGKDTTSSTFLKLVRELYNTMDNMDIFLNRVKPYVPVGRLQTEEQAKVIDQHLLIILKTFSAHPYITVDADEQAAITIVNLLKSK